MRVALGASQMGHPAPFPIPPRYGHIDCATRDVSTYVTKAGTLGSQAFRKNNLRQSMASGDSRQPGLPTSLPGAAGGQHRLLNGLPSPRLSLG